MIFQGNWIDLFIVVGVLIFAIDGLRAGFIGGVLELLGFLVSLVFAFLLFSKVSVVFTKFFSIPESFATAAGFLLVWFIVESLYYFIGKFLLSKIPSQIQTHLANRLSGVVPAVINGLVFSAFLLTLFTALPVPGTLKSAIFGSQIGNFLISRTNQLEKPLQNVFGPAVADVQKSLTFLTIIPESRQVVDLKFTQKELRLDPVSEEKMLSLVNHERTERGLKALVADSAIRDVARAHSRDMFQRGYFSHYSPEGEDAGSRLTNAGVAFIIAGENLAYAPDVIRAHDGLMDSSGHRRNILTPEFGRVGIGVIDGGVYGKMFTQVFTD